MAASNQPEQHRRTSNRPPEPGCGGPPGAEEHLTRLIEKLERMRPAVVSWLVADESRARLFASRPAEALGAAGVSLSAAERRTLRAASARRHGPRTSCVR